MLDKGTNFDLSWSHGRKLINSNQWSNLIYLAIWLLVAIIPASNCQSNATAAATSATISIDDNSATEEHLILANTSGYVDFHTETPILLFDNISNGDESAENITFTTKQAASLEISEIRNSTTTSSASATLSENPSTTTTTTTTSNSPNDELSTEDDEQAGDEQESDSNDSKKPFVPPQNVSQYMDYIERLFHDLRHQVSYFFEPHIPQLIRTSQMVEMSPACSHDILRMALALRQLEPWALKMIDSSGKLPEGIFEGSFTSLGSYDQCLNILFTSSASGGASSQQAATNPTVNATTSLLTQGKYCLVNVSPFLPPKPSPFERVDRLFQEEANRRNYSKDDQLSRLSPMFYYMRFRIGICVPSTCDSGDMLSISQALSSSLKLNITVDACRFKQTHPTLSTNQLVGGSLAASIILLVLAATLFDYWRASGEKLLRRQRVEICLMNRERGDRPVNNDGANISCTHNTTRNTNNRHLATRPVSRVVLRLPTASSKTSRSGSFHVVTNFADSQTQTQSQSQSQSHSHHIDESDTNETYYSNTTTTRVADKQPELSYNDLEWTWRSFSLIANFKLYFQPRDRNSDAKSGQSADQLINCLNGIRVISLCWVIIANSYVTLDPRATKGLTKTREAPRDFLFQLIVQASLAIETFFFLSGLLMSLSFSRNKLHESTSNKNKNSHSSFRINFLNWLRFYLHRYIRLTAPAMLIIALAMFAHRYGDGPLWHEVTHRAHLSCGLNWWRHLLHVANFIDTRQTCFIHFWYIAADMQLFLIAPILLLLLNKFARFGIILIGSLGFSSVYWIFYTTFMRNLPPTLLFYSSDPESRREFGNTIMTKPYTHLLPYLVGMLLGHWLHNNKAQLSESKSYELTIEKSSSDKFINLKFLIMSSNTIKKLVGLCASLIVLAEIFLPYLWNNSQLPSPLIGSLYAALFRFGWALSLAYLVISCRHKPADDCLGVKSELREAWCWCGSGGSCLNQLLSLNIFNFLSRLSFVAYLIHLPLMSVFVAQTRAIFAFSHMLVIHLALSYLLMTFILSFILVHIIEFPFVTFERYLFERLISQKPTRLNQNHNKIPKNHNYAINYTTNQLQNQQQDLNSKTNTNSEMTAPARA